MMHSIKPLYTPLMDRPKVGIGVIIVRDGMIFLMKRAGAFEHGTWSPPGGHLEHGESPEECAIRETFEETGLRMTSARVIALTNDLFPESGKHYVTILLRAENIDDGPVTLNPAEASDYGWFPLDALPTPLFPTIRNVLSGGSLIPFDPLSLV